jgi:signal peptidase I
MVPTLNVGDLLIIQGVEGKDIAEGDIIVFYAPNRYGDPNYRFVHRVIKVVQVGGQLAFETKGDNNPVSDYYFLGYIPASHVVGKVVGRIPYVGYVAMVLQGPFLIAVIVTLIIVILAVESLKVEEKPKRKK